MKSMKQFLKNELHGWTWMEVLWLALASVVILAVSLSGKDNWIGITSALTGVWCVIFTGKGKRSSFLFGMVNVLCYIYISMQAKFYGEVMLNTLYYIPMNVVGWVVWTKHMDDDSGEVKKEALPLKSSLFIYVGTLVGVVAYGRLLKWMGGELPYVDSLSTVVAVVAQVLSIKRLTEQWVLWIVVNVVSVIMWGINYANGGESVATIAMWSVYLVNAIIMYIKWKKEAT